MGMPSGSRPIGMVITGYALMLVSTVFHLLSSYRMSETYKLEQRFVDLRHERRRKEGRRERSFCHLQSDVGLRLYRFRGTACACGRMRSSKLAT